MEKKEKKKEEKPAFVEGVTSWVGSGPSLVLHTFVFLAAFLLGAFVNVPLSPYGHILC